MFFPRLRRQAKWAFAGMVLVFALAFVVAGVGSGSGIGDLLQGHLFGGGGGGSSTPSISKAKARVAKNPRDAAAWHDLALAYEAKQQTPQAVQALKHYVKLRPKDANVLGELARQQQSRATDLQKEAGALYQAAQQANPGQLFQPSPTSKLGQALGTDPITQAVSSTGSNYAPVFAQSQTVFHDSVVTYQRLAKLQPTIATTQEDLGIAAANAGDTKTAIAAFKRYLKLAPDASDASTVRADIARLKAQLPAPPKKKRGK